MKLSRPVVLLIFCAVLLSVIQVALANRFVSLGSKISKVREEVSLLEEQNSLLRKQIASASALTNIAAQAEIVGLTAKPTAINLDFSASIATPTSNSLY